MSSRLAIFAGSLVVAIMVAACVVATLKVDFAPEPEKGKPVVRERNFGEGIRLTQHGLYGIDLVSIGKAHMRKLRKGPFTIGAINELVLEDVSLALPEELWRGEKGESGEKGEKGETDESGPKAMLGKLGINAGQLKLGAKIPRFSALTIRNLRVSRIDETNAVPWFAAVRGAAVRGGLKLSSGWSLENGRTNAWQEALLLVEPHLALVPQR